MVPFQGLGPSSRLIIGLLTGIIISGITISGFGTSVLETLFPFSIFLALVTCSFLIFAGLLFFSVESLLNDSSFLTVVCFDFTFFEFETWAAIPVSFILLS
jgi:hypothetical protein